jgi:hypothetical protein
MTLAISKQELADFLVFAKRNTYAAEENRHGVKPALPSSHQHEIRDGALFYLDIYFGSTYFTGHETVYYKTTPIWGMSYAGGVSEDLPDEEVKPLFDFLRQALRQVEHKVPFRGPETFQKGDYRYSNRVLGNLSRFSGTETIFYQEQSIYHLHYSGGLIR